LLTFTIFRYLCLHELKTLLNMKRSLLVFILFGLLINLNAQVVKYARMIDSTLSSEAFAGRGYVDGGEHKAALYIAEQMEQMKLKSFTKNYLQPFRFSINTILKEEGVIIDGQKFKAGLDYMVAANSPSLSGTFNLIYLPDSLYDDKEATLAFLRNPRLKHMFILTEGRFKELKYAEGLQVKGIVYRSNRKKLYWHVSKARKQQSFVTIDVIDTLISPDAKTITLSIKSKFIKKYKANNVIGYVEGKKHPDSFIVFTAHYDHLGKMGEHVFFPGASDNASGVSMVLSLARHFSKPENQPDYSVVFALVSGEEVGLLGSFYLSDHPLFPLAQVKSLLNLDMVGTGSKGITVVNGKFYPQIFFLLDGINEEMNLLPRVKQRGESCNSDHCPFHKKGVPSVFIFTMGDENREYHTITDTYDRMTFTEFEDLFVLLSEYVKRN
jgi:aminopeptidase YwaD